MFSKQTDMKLCKSGIWYDTDDCNATRCMQDSGSFIGDFHLLQDLIYLQHW